MNPNSALLSEMPGVQMSVEFMSDRLTKTRSQVRNELMAEFSDADWKAYNYLVNWLRETGIASHSLQIGETAPDFLLPDANGLLHSSEHLRRDGPLVVSFYRGGWCPFCKAELRALQEAEAEIDRLGAKLVVVSPETRDLPRQLKQELNLELRMLSDVDHGVAISYGILFRVPDETKAHYAGQGYNFGDRHGSTEWMLPLPATFVIDQDGIVRSAFVEPDFTIRQEPSAILSSIRQLVGSEAEDTSCGE